MTDPNALAEAPAAGAQAGLRVIDWTHVLAGPFAGCQLGLLGAEVIRVERADGDDLIRSKAADPALGALGLGEAFVAQGAGKRSLAVDLGDPRRRGAGTRALLAEAGLEADTIEAMLADGAAWAPPMASGACGG